jgi:SagB-type dehydrogenase family enzyme
MEPMKQYREFLKSGRWKEWGELETDQRKEIPPPPPQKPCPEDATLIDLVAHEDLTVGGTPLPAVIDRRRSRRRFTDESLTLEELSFLLWATQGVREVLADGRATRRTVPSAGSRHPFETYLFISRVESVEVGLYRYLPLDHKLCFISTVDDMESRINDACHGQSFAGQAAAVFVWTTIPYRTEWRYGYVFHKAIALDAGHVCQNLYLASEAIGAGTCAIGAYDQGKMDSLIGVDGKDEFTVYLAPVGRIEEAAV